MAEHERETPLDGDETGSNIVRGQHILRSRNPSTVNRLTPIVAVLYIIRHGCVLADGLSKDLPLVFTPQDEDRPTLTFGVFERPHGNADLDEIERSLRTQMIEQGAKYSDIVLVAFRNLDEATEMQSRLEWDELHLDHDSMWSRLCFEHGVRGAASLDSKSIEAGAENAAVLEAVWGVYISALQKHDFTYNSEERYEASWAEHDKRAETIRNYRAHLRGIGKGEMADKYFNYFSAASLKAKCPPTDEVPLLNDEMERYRKLLQEHDFSYASRPVGLAHFQECEEREARILDMRQWLHAIGHGEIADQLYQRYAPDQMYPVDPEFLRD